MILNPIDPHPEIEILLAFLTLLHLFNPSFPKTTVFGIAGRMATAAY